MNINPEQCPMDSQECDVVSKSLGCMTEISFGIDFFNNNVKLVCCFVFSNFDFEHFVGTVNYCLFSK